MRCLVALLFVMTLSAGSLFAQNKKGDRQKKDSAIPAVSAKVLNPQLVQQNQTDNKKPAEADQFKTVGNGMADNGTGSVSMLIPKKNEMVGYTNIYEYLQGRVPGLNVNGTSIQIRGVSSLVGSNEPLIILDGVQLSSSIALQDVNPDNVQSVEVLKGPSAAIYGSMGANGVIIIKTKQ